MPYIKILRLKALGDLYTLVHLVPLNTTIERHKTRLNAKVFTQRVGINYVKMFSLASKKDYLQIIIILETHFDFDLHQVDMKN